MGLQRNPDQLAKFLAYVLGRKPDEFGLIPDHQGYVKIKDLLKALSEEDEYKYVRQAHLNEIVLSVSKPPIEISETLIRAVSREHLKPIAEAKNLPKLLYSCVRQRAHPVVLEKGLMPNVYPHIVLSATPEMAKRIGRRFDPEPVLITVLVRKAQASGIVFYQAGDELYLSDAAILPDCISAPPLPKPKEEAKKKESANKLKIPANAGSIILTFDDEEKKKEFLRNKRKREIDRDKEKRKIRKQKDQIW